MNENESFDFRRVRRVALIRSIAASLILSGLSFQGFAQDDEEDAEVLELSPFTVDGSTDQGYRATSTLAGSRIRTDLKDVGSAITVVTKEFLDDIGAVDNETLLAYTPSTEVGGTFGNYTGAGNGINLDERGSFNNPNQNTRVRGLASADNTRNYFLSDIPWDGYVVDRVDMQRGPNAILFGLGSPAGIINVTTHDATFRNDNYAEVRVGSYGSVRGVVRKNFVIIEDQLAAKVALMTDRQKFRQDPAFDDDSRGYFAMKWVPSFLNSDSARFSAKMNYENGGVESNRPRSLTPQDHITPWFNPVGRQGPDDVTNEDGSITYGKGVFPDQQGLGKGLWDPVLVRNESAGPGTGQTRHRTDDASGESAWNPSYVPGVGNYAQNFGGPMFFFDSPTATSPARVEVTEFSQAGGLASDGTIDNNNFLPFSRQSAVTDYVNYASNAELEWATYGQYKRQHLSDPSIFNYYDLLIDGPNKSEWADWDAVNFSLEQTFLNDKVGLELAFFDQTYEDGRVNLTGKDNIYIDTNKYNADGSPNPNAGRPFVSDSMEYGNRTYRSERDAVRLTGFAEYDFRENSDNWLTRIAGKHRFTGLKSEESQTGDTRQFHRFRMEEAYYDQTVTYLQDGTPVRRDWNDNYNLPNTTHYLGGSLINASSASGANLSNISALQLPTSAAVRFWDNTWNSTVAPDAVWNNNGSASTQSENPANYVGWTTREYDVVDSLVGDNMNSMVSQGNLASYEVNSEALIWQGWFLNDAIVGMYGWREDKLQTWGTNAPELPNGFQDVSPAAYNLDFDPTLEGGQSRSYSLVAHVNALPGMDWMPFNMSLSYNTSSNFQPGSGRRDMFGMALAAPNGKTVDKSLFLATKDNKYSLKITDYETSVNNSGSSYITGTWFVGRFVAWAENWANIYKYDISDGFTLDGVAKEGDSRQWRYSLADTEGNFTQEFEDKAVADWRAFTDAIDETFPTYYEAWNITGLGTEVKNFSSQDPAGLSFTQDAISRGTEYEFNAQISDNWHLALNASETEAIRNNVGGEAMIRWVEFVDEWFATTNAGDIRIWNGTGTPIKEMWSSTFRSNYALTELLEGTATPEIRKWRFNALTRYDFREGKVKGLQIGGGIRWQDDVILGYEPLVNTDGTIGYNLGNPYKGPDDTQIDVFASYKRKLENGINWKVQLNVRNLFASDELIPISTQADGSTAAFRIPNDRTWQITNSFDF